MKTQNLFNMLNGLIVGGYDYVPNSQYHNLHPEKTKCDGFRILEMSPAPFQMVTSTQHLNISLRFPIKAAIFFDEKAQSLGFPEQMPIERLHNQVIVAHGNLHQHQITVAKDGIQTTLDLPERIVSDYLVEQAHNMDFLEEVTRSEVKLAVKANWLKKQIVTPTLSSISSIETNPLQHLDLSNPEILETLSRYGFSNLRFSPKAGTLPSQERTVPVIQLGILGCSSASTKKALSLLTETEKAFYSSLTQEGLLGQLKATKRELEKVRSLLAWLRLARFLEGDGFQSLPMNAKGQRVFKELVIKLATDNVRITA